jgi:hypothetical protein
MELIPNKAPSSPTIIGRIDIGATCTTAVVAPVKRPAAPRPAIARPTMKADDVGAAPQATEPISKITNAVRNTHLTLKNI